MFCILATVGWAVEGLASLWMYKQVRASRPSCTADHLQVWAHSHGEKGHTFAEAKREMQMHGLKAYLFKNNISQV